MSKRSCKKYDRMIEDYIDGLLSDKKSRKLEAHLAECEECCASLRFAITLSQMGQESGASISPEARERMLAEARESAKRKQRIKITVLITACVLVVLSLIAVWFMNSSDRENDETLSSGNPVYSEIYKRTEHRGRAASSVTVLPVADEPVSPGGEDITLALLIVSGLLAIASFIAFLISLSSVRRIPSKKDKE